MSTQSGLTVMVTNVWGGFPHRSSSQARCMRLSWVTFVNNGEAQMTLVEILLVAQNGSFSLLIISFAR